MNKLKPLITLLLTLSLMTGMSALADPPCGSPPCGHDHDHDNGNGHENGEGHQKFHTYCSVSSDGVNFGVYSPLNPNPHDAVGTLEVTCHRGEKADQIVYYAVGLSTGFSGTPTIRVMWSTAAPLGYNLFLDPTHLLIWGDGTGGGLPLIWGLPMPTPNREFESVHPIYGRIPAYQDVPPGTYFDVITATLVF